MDITKQEAEAAILAIDTSLRTQGAAILAHPGVLAAWVTLAPKLSEIANQKKTSGETQESD